jgi:hypothetical protein
LDSVKVVNMIPHSLSGEANQDSEPNLAVDPSHPSRMVGTAFTPNPGGGSKSPVFYSDDGGDTWALLEIIDGSPVRDQSVRFASSTGELYAGVLWGTGGNIAYINYDTLRTNDFSGATLMSRVARRVNDDQPFVEAATVAGGADAGKDRVYIGSNDHATSYPSATVDIWLDADAGAPASSTVRLENRSVNRDGFQTRPAVAPDGTVYAMYYAWVTGTSSVDAVIARDDNWGKGGTPFTALTDPGDGKNGRRIATGVVIPPLWSYMGQQRMGGDIAVAVDPGNSSTVYAVYGDQKSGVYSLHLRKSINKGANWGADIRKVDSATNPALAVNSLGRLGFVYQQLTGTSPNQRWQTIIELTTNDFGATTSHVLADTPASTPSAMGDPYLGDYISMNAVGETFYGIFCASNVPDTANFPSGVTFQRNADWGTHQLLSLFSSVVSPSIDPYFFRVGTYFKIVKELKLEIKEQVPDKAIFREKIPKLEHLEKTYASEVKFFERYWDDWLDPVEQREMLATFAKRIDELEEQLASQKAFIQEQERPNVGALALRRAKKLAAKR